MNRSRLLSSHLLSLLALASLVALMLVSLAFVWLAVTTVAPTLVVAPVVPPGFVLAVVKIVALAFVFVRVRAANSYSMQWSSMFILLFIAEGTVRAASDPQPAAMLGWIETACAVLYFAAVLAILGPQKRAARQIAKQATTKAADETGEGTTR